jgi:hypothetical protein
VKRAEPFTKIPGGRAVSRRIVSAAVVAVALLAASGCGANGTDTSVRSGARGAGTELHVADGAADASGVRTVAYRGVQFDVPADWPVYDLEADPSTCVRFDVHAVYLGHPGADMACPAGLIGRADAVLVEPVDSATSGSTVAAGSGDVSTESVNDLQAEVADGGTVTYELDATFPSAGVTATLTYQDSDATVQQILDTFRAVSK